MSTINDGGAAFPLDARSLSDRNQGMSLRQYFAAKAMQGWLASYAPHEKPTPKDVAAFAYAVADAMIAARGEA